MASPNEQSTRLLQRATDARCKHCPPERVCAWDCVQGAGFMDIVIGAMLEQQSNWALRPHDLGQEATREALMETFNG